MKQEGLSPGQKPHLSLVGAEKWPSVAQSEEWLTYVEWASTLTGAMHEHFLKAAELGVHLEEPHLVSNAAVYLWNYNHHCIDSDMLVELAPTFRDLLAHMRKLPKLKYAGSFIYSMCSSLYTITVMMRWWCGCVQCWLVG